MKGKESLYRHKTSASWGETVFDEEGQHRYFGKRGFLRKGAYLLKKRALIEKTAQSFYRGGGKRRFPLDN